MVTVKITGDLELRELRIDPEAVDPEDVELLQDMVQAAVNEADPLRPGAGRQRRWARPPAASAAAAGSADWACPGSSGRRCSPRRSTA